MIKQVDKMPQAGQFVIVYVFGGQIWSVTYEIRKTTTPGGDIKRTLYHLEDDEWVWTFGTTTSEDIPVPHPAVTSEHRIFILS